MTIKERLTILESKIEDLGKKVDNHCKAHLVDRIVQGGIFLGMALILFLLKVII